MGRKLTADDFINKSIEIHQDIYDYSLVDYVNNKEKVKITCKEHGTFEQRPSSHMSGAGCPTCCESKGERKVRLYLESKDIPFTMQKKFKECRSKNTLPFDFYVKSHNLLIEFQGIQHYEAVEYFGGEEALIIQKDRDNLKRDFATMKNIQLLEISYEEIDDVEQILDCYF